MTIFKKYFQFVSDRTAKCKKLNVNSQPKKSLIFTYLLIRHTFIIDQSQCRACTAETAGNSTRQVCNLETSEEQLLTSHNRPVRQVWMYQICGSAKCINDNDLIEEDCPLYMITLDQYWRMEAQSDLLKASKMKMIERDHFIVMFMY